MQQPSSQFVLSLDVGAQRIGVAEANMIARIAHPLTTLQNSDTILDTIATLVSDKQAGALVVGLPRGMSGQETAQTASVRAFVAELEPKLTVPIHWQDEALTSQKAEDELNARRKPYAKGDVDALAATYILDDFLRELGEKTL